MARGKSKILRLLKLGAVSGLIVGVTRAIRSRRQQTSETAWPTIAETAANDGRDLDTSADSSAESSGGSASASTKAGDNDADDEVEG